MRGAYFGHNESIGLDSETRDFVADYELLLNLYGLDSLQERMFLNEFPVNSSFRIMANLAREIYRELCLASRKAKDQWEQRIQDNEYEED